MIALGLAVAFVVWLLVRGSDSTNQPAASSTAAAANVIPPQIVSFAKLQQIQGNVGHPVYWAGTQTGRSTEVQENDQGWVYIRYLPGGAGAGDQRRFLTVVTYQIANAYDRLKASSGGAGQIVIRVPGGGIGLYNKTRPTNVYVAYPGIPYQVEVYDPVAAGAQALVTAGKITPVS